jgi:hypothetical protein
MLAPVTAGPITPMLARPVCVCSSLRIPGGSYWVTPDQHGP